MTNETITDDRRQPRRPRRHRTRRRALIAMACAASLMLGGGAVAAVAWPSDGAAASAAQERTDVATAPITKGTLEGSTTVAGTLAYAGSRQVAAGAGGTVTSLPEPGAEVALGQPLFAIDNQPSYLMHGGIPAWRSFERGMSDGPDVRALEQSLKDLGFFDAEPDEKFTWTTAEAIRRWQKQTGQERTGAIPLGRIVFAAGTVRIADTAVKLGDVVAPGAPMIGITDLTKRVTADLKLQDQALAVVDRPVTIDLPDGQSITGRIASAGVPTERSDGSGPDEVVIPVVIDLDDQASAAAFQQASVTVHIPTERREDVLSVPVEALQALDRSTFGVEVVQSDGTTERIPVTPGLFAGGRVEIAGDGIKAGQEVVVPKV